MTDPTTGGLADTPGPDATPEQDADVRALLAFLRDEPMEMPPDVAARLDAVIAEERRTAALATGSASTTLDPSDAAPSPHASVTVLPTLEERRGPSTKAFKIVGGVAAAALVVVGGVALAGSLGSGSGASVASAGASAASNGDATNGSGVAISASGTQYSTASLATQAAALVAGSPSTPLSGTVPAVPSPESVPGTAGVTATRSAAGATSAPPAFALDKAASCVTALTDGDGSSAVAIDSGTFNGKAALVVVVTDPQDPAALRVFVTAPDCSPNFVQFQQIAKP